MRPLRGIAFKLASVLVFIVMASMIKATAQHVPAGQTVFFRSFFAIPVIFVWLALQRELPRGLKTTNPFGHFWRGLMGTMAMGLGFAGLGYLPLPEVTAIGYAAPILTVVFAAMFLGEEVRLFRISAVAMGVADRGLPAPDGDLGRCRRLPGSLRRHGRAGRCGLCRAGAGLRAPPGEHRTDRRHRVLLLADRDGLVAGDGPLRLGLAHGQILLTSSYREADASLVAPFDYASMIFALGIGYFVFAEVPTWPMLGGAALIVTAGILIIWRERQLGLERARQRKAMTPQG